MPEWSKFTDSEIELIKDKMNHKFERAMIITILLSPIVCLIMPYIPGRRGRGPMIDRMPYWDAVLQMSKFWIAALTTYLKIFITVEQRRAITNLVHMKNIMVDVMIMIIVRFVQQ